MRAHRSYDAKAGRTLLVSEALALLPLVASFRPRVRSCVALLGSFRDGVELVYLLCRRQELLHALDVCLREKRFQMARREVHELGGSRLSHSAREVHLVPEAADLLLAS